MSRGSTLPYTVGAVVVLAVTAHLLADFNSARRETMVSRVSAAVSNGTVNLSVSPSSDTANSTITLRQPSDGEEAAIRSLVENGKENIGDHEFPRYTETGLDVRDVRGNKFCTVYVEERVLAELVSRYPADLRQYKSPQSIKDIASICAMKPESVEAKYFEQPNVPLKQAPPTAALQKTVG